MLYLLRTHLNVRYAFDFSIIYNLKN